MHPACSIGVKRMATNFGFMPVLTGKRYFISYKSDDTKRVGEITRRLNEMGVPMWYDYGIEKGEKWNQQINRAIKESEAFILFATKALFSAEDTWVRKEFNIAKMYRKKKYVVWLDSVNPYENPDEVSDGLKDWFLDVDDLQGIRMAGYAAEHIAWSMVTEFHLITGMKPQPPSPTYQPVPKPTEQKPMAKQQPKPAQKPTPQPVSYKNLRAGNRIPFGQYPQGANGEVQPIEWRVLTVENGRALVISEKLIDCVKYNETDTNVTWKTCTLRKWMNGEFLNKAFSSSEQSIIATVTNQNPDNPEFGTQGGSATQDRIFALSIEEANQYFRNDGDRMAAPTGYAKKQGAWASDISSLPSGEKTGWWWLRSPGSNSNLAAYVLSGGRISQYGDYVVNDSVAVRPAFWLNL